VTNPNTKHPGKDWRSEQQCQRGCEPQPEGAGGGLLICRSSTMTPHRLRRGALHLPARRSRQNATFLVIGRPLTGDNHTFADYMELGHKLYTLDRSIWLLQGRHRDMEVFPDYLYDKKSPGHMMPTIINGKWTYDKGVGRTLDRAIVEDFKTGFYKFEGYNSENGYPTRATLEKMNLQQVGDLLQKKEDWDSITAIGLQSAADRKMKEGPWALLGHAENLFRQD
jgi:hypothetical protein